MSLVLLVDDQPELLEVYTEILEQLGHRVLRAHEGWEALALAHERPPDLVITDLWMDPGMNGRELAHQLHLDPALREIPIILQSAAEDPHSRDVQAFLSKGAGLAEFEALVAKLLANARARRRAPSRRDSRFSSRSSSQCARERTASGSHGSLQEGMGYS